VLGDATVLLAFTHLAVPNEIPRTGGEKAQAKDALLLPREQRVTRDLLLHEAVKRLVLVQAANDIVPVRPGMVARLVLVIAMRLGVANKVQPMLGEFLTEGG
jgi:hypothetical protein